MLVFIFFEKNNFPDFFKHQFGQFSPPNTPSVYWILSREICVVQHGLSVNHKPIGVCPPCRSQKNWQKIHFCPQKFSSKNPIFPPKTRLSLSYSSSHNFGPTECCQSLHRTFIDARLNAGFYFFLKKIISRIFLNINLANFHPQIPPRYIGF